MPSPIEIISSAEYVTKTFQALFESLKAAIGMSHSAEANMALIDVQQKLLEHQTAELRLVEEHKRVVKERDAIKKELLDLKQFKASAGRYKLKLLAPGFTPYVLKESAANGDPPHWLCPECLHRGKIGFIQLDPDDAFHRTFPNEHGNAHLVCIACDRHFAIPDAVFDANWDKFA